jgi:hypothetical protein
MQPDLLNDFVDLAKRSPDSVLDKLWDVTHKNGLTLLHSTEDGPQVKADDFFICKMVEIFPFISSQGSALQRRC